MCLSVCVVSNLLLIVKVLKFYKLFPKNFLSSYLYANVLFIHLCSDGGKEVEWLHLHRLWVVQDSPPSVHSAGRPPISQAMGPLSNTKFLHVLGSISDPVFRSIGLSIFVTITYCFNDGDFTVYFQIW